MVAYTSWSLLTYSSVRIILLYSIWRFSPGSRLVFSDPTRYDKVRGGGGLLKCWQVGHRKWKMSKIFFSSCFCLVHESFQRQQHSPQRFQRHGQTGALRILKDNDLFCLKNIMHFFLSLNFLKNLATRKIITGKTPLVILTNFSKSVLVTLKKGGGLFYVEW